VNLSTSRPYIISSHFLSPSSHHFHISSYAYLHFLARGQKSKPICSTKPFHHRTFPPKIWRHRLRFWALRIWIRGIYVRQTPMRAR